MAKRRIEASRETIHRVAMEYLKSYVPPSRIEKKHKGSKEIIRTHSRFGVSLQLVIESTGETNYLEFNAKPGKYSKRILNLLKLFVVGGMAFFLLIILRPLIFGMILQVTYPFLGALGKIGWGLLPSIKITVGLIPALIPLIGARNYLRKLEKNFWNCFTQGHIKTLLLEGTFRPDVYRKSAGLSLQLIMWAFIFLFIAILPVPRLLFLVAAIGAFISLFYLYFGKYAEIYRRANLTILSRLLPSRAFSGILFQTLLMLFILCILTYFLLNVYISDAYLGPMLETEWLSYLIENSPRYQDIISAWLPEVRTDPELFGFKSPMEVSQLPGIFFDRLSDLSRLGGIPQAARYVAIITFTMFFLLVLLILFELFKPLISNYKKARQYYDSPLLGKETLKQIEPRPHGKWVSILYKVWAVIIWLSQNFLVTLGIIVLFAVIGMELDLPFHHNFDWILYPFYMVKTAAIYAWPQSGLFLYRLVLASMFIPAFLLVVFYLSCGIFRFLQKSRLVFSSGRQPDREKIVQWQDFLKKHKLPSNIRLRISRQEDFQAFWYLWIPVVSIPASVPILPSREHFSFLLFHEVGHLMAWPTRITWEALARTSLSGEGFFEPAIDPWKTESEPDRFALSMLQLKEVREKAIHMIRKHSGTFRASLMESYSFSTTSKIQKNSLFKRLKSAYRFYFLNDLLGYFHPPSAYRAKQLETYNEDLPETPGKLPPGLAGILKRRLNGSCRFFSLIVLHILGIAVSIWLFLLAYNSLAVPPKVSVPSKSTPVIQDYQWRENRENSVNRIQVNCFTGSAGYLYMGTNGGLVRFDCGKNQPERLFILPQNNYFKGNVSCVTVSGESIYVGESKSLYILNKGQCQRIPLVSERIKDIAHIKLEYTQILPVNAKDLIINCSYGILYFTPEWRMWFLTGHEAIWEKNTYVWFENCSTIRYCYDHDKKCVEGKLSNLRKGKRNIAPLNAEQLLVDNKGNLWQVEMTRKKLPQIKIPYKWIKPPRVTREQDVEIIAAVVNPGLHEAAAIITIDDTNLLYLFYGESTKPGSLPEGIKLIDIAGIHLFQKDLWLATFKSGLWKRHREQWERVE